MEFVQKNTSLLQCRSSIRHRPMQSFERVAAVDAAPGAVAVGVLADGAPPALEAPVERVAPYTVAGT